MAADSVQSVTYKVGARILEQPLPTADSTGQCNTFAEHLSGRVETESLAWPLVQLSRDRVELKLRIARDVDALRHVLPEQPIGIFVASALPGALRIAEVDPYVSCHRESLVTMHLRTSVPGQ